MRRRDRATSPGVNPSRPGFGSCPALVRLRVSRGPMASLALALAARRFRMPALRIGARAVVEDQVALRPPTTSKPIRFDRAQLEHHPARQPGHKTGVGPIEALAKPAIGDLQLDLRSAGSGQRGQARCLTLKPPTIQQAIDQIYDQAMQLSQAGELIPRNLGYLERNSRTVGCSERIGIRLWRAARLARDGQVRDPQKDLRTHAPSRRPGRRTGSAAARPTHSHGAHSGWRTRAAKHPRARATSTG